MNTKLLHFTTMFREKKKAKHCNLSASLSYPDILQQTIENYTYKVSTTVPHHFSHSSPERYLGLYKCSGMKLLVKTCCKIIYHVLNKRFKTKEILPCMTTSTNFGKIRCSPALLPEKIDGNVNCRVHRYTWMNEWMKNFIHVSNRSSRG